MKNADHHYVIRKYVAAPSIAEALLREKKAPVVEIALLAEEPDGIGFHVKEDE